MLFLLFLFLIVFPKGGFKLGELPITWGYLLLGIAAIASLYKPIVLHPLRSKALCCLIPFQILSAVTLFVNGTQNPEFTIAFIITFFFLPLIFLLLLPLPPAKFNCFLSYLKKGILFIAVYGLALFIYRLMTGNFFEIPFLTTNFNDFSLLDEKCNLRTAWMAKLISTYNNGNIYGLCLLMQLPLYSLMEKSLWKNSLVKFSLLLTLSRTVWIGLLVHEILFGLFVIKNIKNMFLKCFILTITIGIVLYYLEFDATFILDDTLGGRADQFAVFSDLSLFSTDSFEGLSEIVYIGILSSFGVLGLITYLLAVLGPLCLSFLAYSSPVVTAIRCGLCNYLFLSCSDGAILFIPVMAIFWFYTSLVLSSPPPQD